MPSSLAGSLVGLTGVLLTWTDNSADETGFIVRSQRGDADWVEVALAANTNTYNDSAPFSTSTRYAVCAENTNGRSWWSNEVSISTSTAPASQNCALVIEDPGPGDSAAGRDDGGALCRLWVCDPESRDVLASNSLASGGDEVVLDGGSSGHRVGVRGALTSTPDYLRAELELAVLEAPWAFGTEGETCLCLHPRSAGEFEPAFRVDGLAGRPLVRISPLGLRFAVREAAWYRVGIAIDRVAGTWSVTLGGLSLVENLPLDAVVSVPSVFLAPALR